MNEVTIRIRKVFKDSKISQTAFAKKIGVTPAYIWKILNNDETSPSDRTITDICREFSVSETWMRTGDGEPYVRLDEDAEFIQVCEEINISDDNLIKQIIKTYWHLSKDEKAVVRKLIDGISQK